MTSKKRKARELAMQVLFVWDAGASDDRATAEQVVAQGTGEEEIRRAALEIARKAWGQREITDPWVERIAPQWPVRRQPGVDRALIRLAVWELTSGETPPRVVLDEAIEMAKEFSTENSPAFVNGVLDAIFKEQQALTAGLATPAAPPVEYTPAAGVAPAEADVEPSLAPPATAP